MAPSASRGISSPRCPCSPRRRACTLQSGCCPAGSSRTRAGSTSAATPSSRCRPASSRPIRADSVALVAVWAASAAADGCNGSARRRSPGSRPGCTCIRCTSSRSWSGRTGRRRTRRRGTCGWHSHCGPEEAPRTCSCSCGRLEWRGRPSRACAHAIQTLGTGGRVLRKLRMCACANALFARY